MTVIVRAPAWVWPASDGDDDLAHRPSLIHVAQGVDDLGERVAPVDGRLDLARREQVLERCDVVRVERLPRESSRPMRRLPASEISGPSTRALTIGSAGPPRVT